MSSHNLVSEKSICSTVIKILIYFFVFWYVLICLINYFNQRPLWNDEECVFASIQSYDFKAMFNQELTHLQVFPRLYLFLIQQFSKVFNFHVLSLRFFPFVCMIFAFFVWLRLAKYEFKNRLEYFNFVLSWSASSMLIYYSSELKQYSMDVLTAAVWILFLYNQEKVLKAYGNKIYCAFLAFLPFLGLLSYPAFLFAPILIYNSVILAKREKNHLWPLFILILSFMVSAVVSYHFDMRLRPAAVLDREWGDYFISFESAGEFFKTLGEGTNNLFSRWWVERPRFIKGIGRFFEVFGFIYLFCGFFARAKKEKHLFNALNTIAFFVFMELLILGAFRKYPYTVPRTSLFFCPIILCLTIQGIAALKNVNRHMYRIVHGLYFIFLVFLTICLSRLVFTGRSVFNPIL